MMNRETGTRLDAMAHLRQSVADILTTPIGSRVMRREYGSLVPALIDQPDNLVTRTRLFSAIVSALLRWEPRIQIDKIRTTRDPERPGAAEIHIDGSYLGNFGREASPLALSVPLSGKGVA